ncbi:MAG: hypothetical protein AAFR76_05830 [Planctomycetota bacterium]
MLNDLLAEHKDDLIAAVMSKLGVNADQGGGFVNKLIEMVQDKVGSGDLDLSALLSGDLGSLKSALNLEVLGSALGGGADKGEEGLGAVIGPLKDKLGGMGDAGVLLGKTTGSIGGGKGLGGLGDALGGMLGGQD